MSVNAGHEIEVKLKREVIAPFQRLGVTLELTEPRHFEENILFDTPDNQLQSRLGVLRVRIVEGNGVLTYKAPPLPGDAASEFKKRIEIETSIGEPQQLIAILTRLGYLQWFTYQKYRTVYRGHLPSGRSLWIMNDETPIGTFVELEGEEPVIREAVEMLGVTPDEYILLSYIALQAEHCQRQGRQFEDMVFA
ncbi:MAG: class IV adenylate cyclase [Acidobacteriota bacterium]